jgi:hypothetical protein
MRSCSEKAGWRKKPCVHKGIRSIPEQRGRLRQHSPETCLPTANEAAWLLLEPSKMPSHFLALVYAAQATPCGLDVPAENSPEFCFAAPQLQVMLVRGKQQPSPPTALPWKLLQAPQPWSAFQRKAVVLAPVSVRALLVPDLPVQPIGLPCPIHPRVLQSEAAILLQLVMHALLGLENPVKSLFVSQQPSPPTVLPL